MSKAFIKGFEDYCKQAGVDPQELAKLSQELSTAPMESVMYPQDKPAPTESVPTMARGAAVGQKATATQQPASTAKSTGRMGMALHNFKQNPIDMLSRTGLLGGGLKGIQMGAGALGKATAGIPPGVIEIFSRLCGYKS